MLFHLRHKKPRIGIVESLIEIDDPKLCTNLQEAERIGRALCDQEPGYLYISVDYAIINKRPKSDTDVVAVRKAS